jgi:SOS response regulatory protein OraA/RecX
MPIESVFPLPPKDLFNSENDKLTERIDEGLAILEQKDTTPAELEEYLMAKLLLPVGGERVPATVL